MNRVVSCSASAWDDIIASTQDGTYSTKYSVGDTKTLDLGSEGKVKMQLVAMDADELASGSGTAPTTWISKQLLNTNRAMNSTSTTEGGWTASGMRTYLKNTVKPLIPSNVRSAIKDVTKYSSHYENSAVVKDVTSTDDVWIPSHREIFNKTTYETLAPAYSSMFVDANSRKKFKAGTSSVIQWWLRSAYDTTDFRGVNDGYDYRSTASNNFGVALGFCI